jgi:hypothetical protein
MLATTGSMEIAEWIAHISLTAREENEAVERAKNAQPPVMGG